MNWLLTIAVALVALGARLLFGGTGHEYLGGALMYLGLGVYLWQFAE